MAHSVDLYYRRLDIINDAIVLSSHQRIRGKEKLSEKVQASKARKLRPNANSGGKVWGGDSEPPPHQLGVSGSVVLSPNGIRSTAPTVQNFYITFGNHDDLCRHHKAIKTLFMICGLGAVCGANWTH